MHSPPLASAAESTSPAQPGPTLHLHLARSQFGSPFTGRTCDAQMLTLIGFVPKPQLQGLHQATTRPCTAPLAFAVESSAPAQPGPTLHSATCPCTQQFSSPLSGQTCDAQVWTRIGFVPLAQASRPAPCPGDSSRAQPLWHSRPRALCQPSLALHFTWPLASSTQPVWITALGPCLLCSKLRSRIGSTQTGSTPLDVPKLQHGIQPT